MTPVGIIGRIADCLVNDAERALAPFRLDPLSEARKTPREVNRPLIAAFARRIKVKLIHCAPM